MTVDDRTRLNLHRKLEAVLGPEEADTLMAHLPPVTWNDVATKHDVATLGASLRGEIAELRGEMRSEIAELRGEMRSEFADVRGEMRSEIAGVRGEIAAVHGEMRAGFSELRGELAGAIASQTRWLMTVGVAWSALLVTAVRFLP